MHKQRILMCAPEFFGVHYVINPWMEGHLDSTSQSEAAAQWSALYAIVQQHAEIELLTPQSGLPDLVFTANAAVLRGKKAILSSFLYAERQPEEQHFQHWFADHGFDVHTLPREISFEGAGDALFTETADRLFLGHGVRSSVDALPYLQRILEVEVQPLALLQTRFYHLDTCFCPLERGYLLYYPAAFDGPSNRAIEHHYPAGKRLAVTEDDATLFACNAINIGSVVILNQLSAPATQWLHERGFTVIETATSEFLKAGGSTKCLSLRLD